MTNFISLLRGINVSGQKKIKMADLRAVYEGLGFKNVKSYIQSGNLVFQSDESPDNLAGKIQSAIEDKYGFSVEIFIFEQSEWQSILANNPFAKDTEIDKKFLYMTLLSEIPDEALLPAISELDFGEDEYRIVGTVIYLHCPNGYGRTKLTNNFWERKLRLNATTRNWNTSTRLYELVETL